MKDKLLWVVPWKQPIGGINAYSRFLWPAVREAWEAIGNTATPEPYIGTSINHIHAQSPKIIHIQHEYGLFGLFGKYPPFYGFPGWMKKLKEAMPETTIVATAHTVISERPPSLWRGHDSPISRLASLFLLPYVRRRWVDDTWRLFDAVTVHSSLQVKMVASVCDNVQVIPHVIPNLNPTIDVSTPSLPTEKRLLIVFGFIRRSKGHDLAIKALARMKHEASLVIAGGVRTRGDLIFLRECLRLADRLGVAGRVRVTGYVPENSITALYRRAVLAVAPFRQSSGSGSLAIGLASGTPTVASDISLNKEILEREPGCLTLFASENPEKLAEEVDRLLDSQVARESIVRAARRYARSCSPSKIAQKHVALYSHFT